MRRLASLFLLCALSACADKTGILVEVVSSDLSVPTDVDALRFQAMSDRGPMVDQTFPIQGDWPHSLTIIPATADDTSIDLTVTGMLAGAVRVRRVLPNLPFQRGMTTQVLVTLSRDCLDVPCAPGVDCVNGMCVGELPDGGMDAGMLDAGPIDAGPIDAGREDAGPVDAGRDAGRDAGMDAGRDAGMDAGRIDAGPVGTGVLIISEYVEGSSFNKYIEIFNPTLAPIDLAGHALRIYTNGSLTPGSPINLSGVLASGDVYIVAEPRAVLAGVTPDLSTGSLNFNGNDVVVLEGPSGQLDIVGTIGDGTDFALNVTFVRRPGIVVGRTTGGWLTSQWTMLGTDMNMLGFHNP